jgi:hypothetical protein
MLNDPSVQFVWTASAAGFNWIGFEYQQVGAGPLLATGAGSRDVFFSNRDLLNPPYNPGRFFYYFGGNPEASFHIQVFGTPQ